MLRGIYCGDGCSIVEGGSGGDWRKGAELSQQGDFPAQGGGVSAHSG